MPPRIVRISLTIAATAAFTIILSSCRPDSAPPPVERWTAANAWPHDPAAFTQGLVWHNGFILEGTGQRGHSGLRRVELQTGRVMAETPLTPDLFGEGIAILDDRIYQLTWQARKGFIYRLDNLQPSGAFAYTGEGWGLTTDATHLILSDGSARLRFIDPNTFHVVRTIDVTSSGKPVPLLNELEWIEGEIWANVWKSDRIARIDPRSGRVIAWVDLTETARAVRRPGTRAEALNGIAWDPEKRRILVTGKYWPVIYEIKPATPDSAAPIGR